MRRTALAGRMVAVVLVAGSVAAAAGPQQTNAVAAVLEQFQERVKSYVKLQKDAQATLAPFKTTEDADLIRGRQQALAEAIRRARPDARQGDIFIPEVAPLFRKLVAADFKQRTAEQRKATMKEVPAVHLQPNQEYPEELPLATVPPKLLGQLPRLPDGLEFRFAGNSLVIRDSHANLVVDVLDDAIPRQ